MQERFDVEQWIKFQSGNATSSEEARLLEGMMGICARAIKAFHEKAPDSLQEAAARLVDTCFLLPPATGSGTIKCPHCHKPIKVKVS